MTKYEIREYSQKLADYTAKLLRLPAHAIVFTTKGLYGLISIAIKKLRYSRDAYFDDIEEETREPINCDLLIDRITTINENIFKYIWIVVLYALKFAKVFVLIPLIGAWWMIKLFFIGFTANPKYYDEENN